MYYQTGFLNRSEFCVLLRNKELLGEAVEIGTHTGEFACSLLRGWFGEKLWCVDPYIVNYSNNDPASKRDIERRLNDLALAQAKIEWTKKEYNRKTDVEFIKKLSSEAVTQFENNSLDFVYIDGNHEYDYVLHDLEDWYPKIKTGGILAGHDIICPGELNGGWGVNVQNALNSFCEDNAINVVYLVVENTGAPWSFYIEKE